MTKKIRDLSPQEVLSLAISVERSNHLSLRTFSQFFEGNNELEIAFGFKELANEELEHEALLKKNYAELFGAGEPVPVELEFEDPERKAMLNVFKDKSPGYFDKARKIFELALLGETRAKEFYKSAAEASTQEELRNLYNKLSAMEDKHSGWLESKINRDKS